MGSTYEHVAGRIYQIDLTSGEINFLSDYTGDPELLNQTVSSTEGLTIVSTKTPWASRAICKRRASSFFDSLYVSRSSMPS